TCALPISRPVPGGDEIEHLADDAGGQQQRLAVGVDDRVVLARRGGEDDERLGVEQVFLAGEAGEQVARGQGAAAGYLADEVDGGHGQPQAAQRLPGDVERVGEHDVQVVAGRGGGAEGGRGAADRDEAGEVAGQFARAVEEDRPGWAGDRKGGG